MSPRRDSSLAKGPWIPSFKKSSDPVDFELIELPGPSSENPVEHVSGFHQPLGHLQFSSHQENLGSKYLPLTAYKLYKTEAPLTMTIYAHRKQPDSVATFHDGPTNPNLHRGSFILAKIAKASFQRPHLWHALIEAL